MLADGNHDVKITRPTTAEAGLALAGNADAVTFIYTGRNFDGDSPLMFLKAAAAAIRARFFNDLALTAAISTNGGVDKLSEEAALNALYLAGAFTGGTADGLDAGLRASAVAGGTNLGAVNLNFFFTA
jgi:hypothetical protein